MHRLLRTMSVYGSDLMNRDNVVGMGVGFKEIGGKPTGRIAIVVMVSKKMPMSSIARNQAIPRQINSIHTDVLEVGELTMLSRLGRVRPATPGVSIGHLRVTAGTFGALVKDQETGAPLILSNNHVLANITDGRDGRAQKGDVILQPGRADGGTSSDRIGLLERFVPILRSGEVPTCSMARRAEAIANWLLRLVRPSYQLRLYRASQGINLVDAAVARPDSPDLVSPKILEVGEVSSTREPEIGERVIKSGRTSGVSGGEIKVIGATLKVMMGDVGTAVFSDQIVTTPMAEPGDSGSLLLSLRREALGLIAAGSDRASIAGKIGYVMDLLKVAF